MGRGLELETSQLRVSALYRLAMLPSFGITALNIKKHTRKKCAHEILGVFILVHFLLCTLSNCLPFLFFLCVVFHANKWIDEMRICGDLSYWICKVCINVLASKLFCSSICYIQYNTIQYNTIQYNTIQYNTIQYNTLLNFPRWGFS